MSVTLADSPLYDEIHEITKPEAGFRPHFLLAVTIHTKEKDLTIDDGVILFGQTLVRDYVGSMGDYIDIDLKILPGTFVYDLYPYADELEVTLSITKQLRTTGGSYVTDTTYTASYPLDKNNQLPTNSTAPREVLNTRPHLDVKLQLTDKSVMAMRVLTCQGIVNMKESEKNKDMKPDAILKSIINTETDKLKVGGKPIIDKITIEPGDNDTPRETVVIPTGTRVVELANLIQDQMGGIYRAGCNSYIQNYSLGETEDPEKNFFVYSLYDGTKYHKAENTCMLFVSTSTAWNSSSCNHKYRNNILRLFTNPLDTTHDPKGVALRSQGDGFRSASSDSINVGGVDIKEDGPHYKITQTFTEVSGKEHTDGLVNAPYTGISGNHFKDSTEIFSRAGQYVQLVVDNLDPDFLSPGLACMITREYSEGLVQELYGVLHKVTARFEYKTYDGTVEKEREYHGLFSRVILLIYVTELNQSS